MSFSELAGFTASATGAATADAVVAGAEACTISAGGVSATTTGCGTTAGVISSVEMFAAWTVATVSFFFFTGRLFFLCCNRDLGKLLV